MRLNPKVEEGSNSMALKLRILPSGSAALGSTPGDSLSRVRSSAFLASELEFCGGRGGGGGVPFFRYSIMGPKTLF